MMDSVLAPDPWRPLGRYWRLVLAAGVAGAAVGLAAGVLVKPSYQATATIQVLSSDPAQIPTVAESKQVATAVLTGEALLAKVAADLGLGRPPVSLAPEALRGRVSVEDVAVDSTLLRVRVTLPDAALAARAANALIEEGAGEIDEYWRGRRRRSLGVLEARAEEAKRELDQLRERVVRSRPEATGTRDPRAALDALRRDLLLKDQALLDLDAASQVYVAAAEVARQVRVETAVPGRHGVPADRAVVPRRPVYPKPWLNAVVGLVAGLLFGWVAAIAADRLHLRRGGQAGR